MIREMEKVEADFVRTLIAKLDFEDQTLWRKQLKSLEECLQKSNAIRISREIEGKNAIFVADEEGKIVGFCWCTVVDRGVDRQGEIAEFYVEKDFRSRGIGRDLIAVAKQFFIDEKVEVAFVWTHHANQAAIELYKMAGFNEVTQLVMAFVPTTQSTNQSAEKL
jgi:ribosomal protein S18 acetylase RimI-like enzyme